MALPFTLALELDSAKDRLNRRNNGIPLSRAFDFDVASAHFILDDSQDYGEERWNAIGLSDAALYVIVFAYITDVDFRVISLRPAEPEERRAYAQR